MRLVNGRADATIFSGDRGLQFGDGCFTTARVKAGKICYFTDHIQRLERDCQRLDINFQQWAALTTEMHALAANHSSAVLKVIITRGSGGRGYGCEGCESPSRIVSLSAFPEQYANWQRTGISLVTSPIRLGLNPALAGIKHLNRLEQVLIKQHLAGTDAQEALVLDFEGNIVECCAANIIWRKGQVIYTPKLTYAGVDGTMKNRIIAALVTEGYACQQVTEPLNSLAAADEVLVCNALMPVIPVSKLDHWHYSSQQTMAKLRQLGFTTS